MPKDQLFSFTPKEKTFREKVSIPHYRHGSASFDFKYVPPSELPAVVDGFVGKPMVDVLDDLISGWDVKNDMGEELPYSREALDALLKSLYCGQRIYDAWIAGLPGAREKN